MNCPDLRPGEDDLIIPFRKVLYCRGGDGQLTLEWEPAGKTDDVVLYVPREESWKRDMPPWARERRTELVHRILELAKKRGWDFIVREY